MLTDALNGTNFESNLAQVVSYNPVTFQISQWKSLSKNAEAKMLTDQHAHGLASITKAT